MGGRSRVAVRHAAAVAHCSTVEDAATLMKMLALPASPADEASCSGAMASAIVDLALELQRTASFAFPGKKVASLRDGAFHLRRAGAPGSLLKKLGLLNSAASLLRHFDLAWASSLRLELAEALPAVSVLPQERETASSRDGDASSARTSHRAEDDSGASSDLEAPSEAAPAGDRAAAGPDAAAGASVAKLIERFEPPRLAPAQGLPEHPRQPEGSHAPPRQDEPQLGDQHEVPQAGQPLAAQPDAHPLHDVLLHPDGVPGAACAPLRDHDPPAVPLPAVPRADTPPPLGTAALLRGAPWADDETDETEDGHNDDDDALDRVATPEELPELAPSGPSPQRAASPRPSSPSGGGKGKGKSSKGKGKGKRACQRRPRPPTFVEADQASPGDRPGIIGAASAQELFGRITDGPTDAESSRSGRQVMMVIIGALSVATGAHRKDVERAAKRHISRHFPAFKAGGHYDQSEQHCFFASAFDELFEALDTYE